MMSITMRAFALLSVAALSGCESTPVAPEPPPLELIRVHEVPGKSKAQLCREARDWAAMTFRDSKAVIEVFDAEAGTMIGKGYVTIPFTVGKVLPVNAQWRARFTMAVECRDGRVRAAYRDVVGSTNAVDQFALQDNSMVQARSIAESKLSQMDDSLRSALTTKPAGDDW